MSKIRICEKSTKEGKAINVEKGRGGFRQLKQAGSGRPKKDRVNSILLNAQVKKLKEKEIDPMLPEKSRTEEIIYDRGQRVEDV